MLDYETHTIVKENDFDINQNVAIYFRETNQIPENVEARQDTTAEEILRR